MNFANEGTGDRALRMLTGLLLVAVAWSDVVAGATGLLIGIVGGIMLATGVVGWCPAYSACGISTRSDDTPACLTCEPDRRA